MVQWMCDAKLTLSLSRSLTRTEQPSSEGGEAEGEEATADVTAAATTHMDEPLATHAEHALQLDGQAEGAEEEQAAAEVDDGKDKALVDAALDAALLQALRTTVKDKLLPMSQGQVCASASRLLRSHRSGRRESCGG